MFWTCLGFCLVDRTQSSKLFQSNRAWHSRFWCLGFITAWRAIFWNNLVLRICQCGSFGAVGLSKSSLGSTLYSERLGCFFFYPSRRHQSSIEVDSNYCRRSVNVLTACALPPNSTLAAWIEFRTQAAFIGNTQQGQLSSSPQTRQVDEICTFPPQPNSYSCIVLIENILQTTRWSGWNDAANGIEGIGLLQRAGSISKFSCRSRNITSHSMKTLAVHTLLRWKMIALPIFVTTSLIHVFQKVMDECRWWTEIIVQR